MPRPGRMQGTPEKSKDFWGSVKKLLLNLKKWKFLIFIGLFLAMISAIFSIVSPNILSDLTDTISLGLVPKTEIIEDLSKKIVANAENGFPTFDYKGNKISTKDQVAFMDLLNSIQGKSKEEYLDLMDELPSSIYNVIKPEINMTKVKKISLTLGIIYLLSALFNYAQEILMATASNRYARDLRSQISTKINKLPLKYFDSHENGDILSRITNDVDTISQNLDQSLETLVISSTLFLGSTIMMFVTNYIMALTAVLASVIGFGFMAVILSRSQKYFNMRQEELGNMNGFIEEIYSGHNVVKAYNGIEEAEDSFKKLNDKLYTANYKSQFLSGLMGPFMGFIGNFGYVAVCIVGAILVIKGNITFGVIVAFMIYVRLFTNPLSRLGQAMTSMQSCVAAAERVFNFTEEAELTDESSLNDKLDIKDAKGAIVFKNVKFGYSKEKTIIKDFSADIKPGQKVAIVGPTGAGKTTIVNLLMKFYEISSGDIIIDGKSIHNLTRENIHDLFCMVLQDTWLFSDTIKENIKFNKDNITIDDINNACKTVGIDHFVKTLPGGINALIDDGDSISQGQKQLFTIARGMLKDAPFLILDEATSNVDTRTEELVQKAMDKLTKGKTSFIIAHRLSTIKNADLILVLKDGNIIEQGDHESLLKQKGYYAELYNSQFEL